MCLRLVLTAPVRTSYMCVRLCLLRPAYVHEAHAYEAFALASAVEQVLFEELGRLGALSLQDLGRLNERLRAHNLLQDKGSVDALLC